MKLWPESVAACPSTVTDAAPETSPCKVTCAAAITESLAGRTEANAGGVVSISKPTASEAVFPAASVAVTASWCVPSPVTWVPEVNAAPSSWASTVTVEASVTWTTGVAARLSRRPSVRAAPLSRTWICGGSVSGLVWAQRSGQDEAHGNREHRQEGGEQRTGRTAPVHGHFRSPWREGTVRHGRLGITWEVESMVKVVTSRSSRNSSLAPPRTITSSSR